MLAVRAGWIGQVEPGYRLALIMAGVPTWSKSGLLSAEVLWFGRMCGTGAAAAALVLPVAGRLLSASGMLLKPAWPGLPRGHLA